MIWAVVPCKKLDAAHRRLKPVLSDTERRQIATNMLMDVLSALAAATCLDGVLVVGADPAVREIAGSFGARSFSNFVDSGLSASLAAASAMLADEGATGVVAVHGDLPYLTPADIAAVVGTLTGVRAVTLAPAKSDQGTNVIALSPPGVIDYAFGQKSSLRHAAAARAQNIEPTFIETPGLAFDLDTVEDLNRFATSASETRTFRFLDEFGIRDRLADRQTHGWRKVEG